MTFHFSIISPPFNRPLFPCHPEEPQPPSFVILRSRRRRKDLQTSVRQIKKSSLVRCGAFVLQRFACFGHSFTKFALTTVQAHKVNFARHPKTTF